MVKVIMKQVPRKMDYSSQHEVMRKWSATIVENHTPKRYIGIISSCKRTIDDVQNKSSGR